MDKNLYDQLSEEIKMNLPDINFDSESDDNDSLNNEPVRPYIRPPAEILFGNEDLTQNEREILEIFTTSPVDNENEDEALMGLTSVGCNTNDLNVVNNGNNNNNLFENQQHLPNHEIELVNNLSSREVAPDTNIELAKFGFIGNMDIDEALQNLNLGGDTCTLFDDALTEIQNDRNDEADLNNKGIGGFIDKKTKDSDSDVMKKLDEMASVYEEESRKNKLAIEKLDATASFKVLKKDTKLSLSDLYAQSKSQSPSDLVFLDLRNKKNALRVNDNNNRNPLKKNSALLDSDSSDDEKNQNEDRNELWIDKYRRMRNEAIHQNAKKESPTKLKQQKSNKNKNVHWEDCSQNKENQNIIDNKNSATITDDDIIESDKPIQAPINSEIVNEDKEILKSIELKVESMKAKEKKLSERRALINRLRLCLNPAESTPLLLHEEITFSSNSYNLVPDLEVDLEQGNNLIHGCICFIPPCALKSKCRLLNNIDDRIHSNFIHIFHLLLSPSLSMTHLDFVTRSLQITTTHIHFIASTNLTITKLHEHIKTLSLKSAYHGFTSINTSFLSQMTLDNFIEIKPYNDVESNNLWKWNSSSIGWEHIKNYDEMINRGAPKFSQYTNIDNSCVIIQSVMYEDGLKFIPFMTKVLQHHYLAGLRLVYNGDVPKLVFIVRGYEAVEFMKQLSTNWSYKPYVTCTRFHESFTKEAAEYFGPRINEFQLIKQLSLAKDLTVARHLKNDDTNNVLFHLQITYELVLISPHILDVGWAINKMFETCGVITVNNWRIKLNSEQKKRLLLDIDETNDNDQNGANLSHVTNVLQVTQEAVGHIIDYAIETCHEFIVNKDTTGYMIPLEQMFWHSPFNSEDIILLNLKVDCQVPYLRDPITDIPLAPFPDCEQFSFVLLMSSCPLKLTTSLIPQLFDMTTHLDLLAMKIFLSNNYFLPAEHLNLLLTVFDLNSATQLIPRPTSCAVLVYRSMFLHSELEKIQNTLKQQSNLVFAYTLDVIQTFRLMGSFFTSSELVSDSRRRIIFKFLPQSIVAECQSNSLINQLELTYQCITSAFKVTFLSSDNICHKLKRFWFLLTREEFKIDDVTCNMHGSCEFVMITSRPNAVFMLLQWTNHFYGQDGKPESLKVLENPNELDKYEKLVNATKLEVNNLFINSPRGRNPSSDSVIVCMHEDLLDSSVESMKRLKCLWNFIDENSFQTKSVFMSSVDETVELNLNKVEKIYDLNGDKITYGRYIVLILEAPDINVVFRSLFKSKCNFMKIDTCLMKKIFVLVDAICCFGVLMKIETI